MAVIIDASCITCDACLQNCPVGAIVDDSANPLGLKRYYVQPDKCVECAGIYDDPQCAAICPSIGCITWDMPYTKEFSEHFADSSVYAVKSFKEKNYRKDIPLEWRGVQKEVQVAPQDEAATA